MSFGAVEEDAEIVTVHAELAADLVLILLLEKDRLEELAVTRCELFERSPDLARTFCRDEVAFEIDEPVWWILLMLLGGLGAGGIPKVLEHHVVADTVDEGAEALRMMKTILGAESTKETGEGLLLNIFDDFRRTEACAEFDGHQLGEIGDKMMLHVRVSAFEAVNIVRVELLEFQGISLSRTRKSQYNDHEGAKAMQPRRRCGLDGVNRGCVQE
jgi:hypothetical protein